MCQQVINLSIACCQQTGNVIILPNLVTSTFSLQKSEQERKPLWILSTSQGSSRLWRRIWRALLHFCQAAEVQRSLYSPLGLIYFHHVYRRGRGVSASDKRREAYGKETLKEKSLRPSSEMGPEAHRQATHVINVCLAARLAGCLYGPWCWVCCPVHHTCKNVVFVLVTFCFFHWGNPIARCNSPALKHSWQPVLTVLEAVIASSI